MVKHEPAAVALGILADHLLGEPPFNPHPVAAFGRAMRAVEGRIYADSRPAGAVHTTTGVALGAIAGLMLNSPAGTGLATYVAVAGRGLRQAAADVAVPLVAGDLETARSRLPALVGRDHASLDAKEVARAVVESLAENTVDAVVAPALWAVVAGAPGILGYRAVNTLDAMVGHRSDRYRHYGWASARLDDAANWVPARVTALLVATVRPRQATAVWTAVRTQAPGHPSPNAGVSEAAFAAALDLRLGGPNSYGGELDVRPYLGSGRPAEPGDIAAAARLSRDVTLALAAVLAAGTRLRPSHQPSRRPSRQPSRLRPSRQPSRRPSRLRSARRSARRSAYERSHP